MKRILAAALAAAFAVACDSPTPPPEPPVPAPPAAPEVVAPKGGQRNNIAAAVHDRDALEITARRLAGLPVEGETSEVWARHAELMDEIWGRVGERHLGPMHAWAEGQLDLAAPEAPLFYPFSGPDLPSALQFFPAAGSIVLVGLEPPGRIPDLEGIDAEGLAGEGLASELERLRGGLDNLAEAGYFVTKRMETDLVAPRLEGSLPVLYIFLARAELTPASIEFVRLDGDGAVVPLETATDRTANAVRIRIGGGEGEDAPAREVFYFAQDLSNSGLESAPAFTAFLSRLGAFNVYMKSASYLLHMEDFTALRDYLVANAGTVLQDDSGIPLRDLREESWQRRFFGTYRQTLPTYREWFQEDLKAIYDQGARPPAGGPTEHIPELPFAIGYHSKIGGSCLIWAERRGE